MTVVLETLNLRKTFGGITATDNVTFKLQAGARHALIGPNGAGKSTLFNVITGQVTPSQGSLRFAGDDITRVPQAQRVKRGLVRTFQISALFRKLDVLENVTLAIAERDLLGMEVLGDDLEAPGPCKDLLFDLRYTAHAGSQEILPAGPGKLIAVLL
mgnify:CR=1 FL=1